MSETQPDLLADNVLEFSPKRRKQLLPWWIKVFMWIFLVIGAFVPVAVIIGILGYNFQVSLYGLETNDPLSIIGILLVSVFLFKGITSYSLLREWDYAITLAIIDAILGIIICTALMLYPVIFTEDKVTFVFRLELLFLIPYLIKMLKIKPEWENIIPFK